MDDYIAHIYKDIQRMPYMVRQVKVSSCVKYIKIGRLHQLHQIYKKTWHACCPLNAEIKWKLFYKFNKL